MLDVFRRSVSNTDSLLRCLSLNVPSSEIRFDRSSEQRILHRRFLSNSSDPIQSASRRSLTLSREKSESRADQRVFSPRFCSGDPRFSQIRECLPALFLPVVFSSFRVSRARFSLLPWMNYFVIINLSILWFGTDWSCVSYGHFEWISYVLQRDQGYSLLSPFDRVEVF